jgi:antitoxin HigA-1
MINNNNELYTTAIFELSRDYIGSEDISVGEVIEEMYMEPLGLSGAQLADAIGVASSTINRVLNGKSSLTPELALKICAVVSGSPDVLLRIDLDYRLAIARQKVDTSQLKSLITT